MTHAEIQAWAESRGMRYELVDPVNSPEFFAIRRSNGQALCIDPATVGDVTVERLEAALQRADTA